MSAGGAELDMRSSGALSKVTSAAIKACLPSGNVKPFPSNCMTAMTMTGAKGSMVNASQIAALLGQQELEGRRVPRMVSGKTLPCFSEFDTGARSCGYIADRFLTGVSRVSSRVHSRLCGCMCTPPAPNASATRGTRPCDVWLARLLTDTAGSRAVTRAATAGVLFPLHVRPRGAGGYGGEDIALRIPAALPGEEPGVVARVL